MPPFNIILPFFFAQAMITAMVTAPVYAMQLAAALVPGQVTISADK